MPNARYRKISLGNSKIVLYGGSRVAGAAADLARNMTLYDGVKYAQILEAVYKQGKKDGAADAFEAVDERFEAAQRAIPHKNPGWPRKRK